MWWAAGESLRQVIQDRWRASPNEKFWARHLIERQPTQMAVPLQMVLKRI